MAPPTVILGHCYYGRWSCCPAMASLRAIVSEADGRWRYCSAMASGQLVDATMAFRRARAVRRAGAERCRRR